MKPELDIAALRPGDVLTTSQLIDVVGCSPDSDKWSWRVNQLKAKIERLRSMFICEQRGKTLAVLTEPEKLEYLERRAEAGLAGFRKSYEYFKTRVDLALLLEDRERRKYESLDFRFAGLERALAAEQRKQLPI